MREFTTLLVALSILAGCEFGEPVSSPIPAEQESTVATESSLEQIARTEEEWRAMLSPQAYHVLREKGTEAPFTNEFDEHFEAGSYACAACAQVLFESDTKFNSGCGWPAFFAAKAGDRVVLTADNAHGMIRTEVTCARCGSHLGHVFDDAPQTPTGQRFCINSVSLKFIPADAQDEKSTADAD